MIAQQRINICKQCPLYKKIIGGAMCNNKLWLDPITNKTSTQQEDGYYRGCGCVLTSKWKSIYSHCPLAKW